MNPIDIIDPVAVLCLALDIDLPEAAEGIELVNVVAAERRLQGAEYLADLNAECLCLVAIDTEIDLRIVGRVGAEDVRQLGLLVCLEHEPAHGGGEFRGRSAGER